LYLPNRINIKGSKYNQNHAEKVNSFLHIDMYFWINQANVIIGIAVVNLFICFFIETIYSFLSVSKLCSWTQNKWSWRPKSAQ
jgi:hypothetical protein